MCVAWAPSLKHRLSKSLLFFSKNKSDQRVKGQKAIAINYSPTKETLSMSLHNQVLFLKLFPGGGEFVKLSTTVIPTLLPISQFCGLNSFEVINRENLHY